MIKLCCVVGLICAVSVPNCVYAPIQENCVYSNEQVEAYTGKRLDFTECGLPNIGGYFKAYMDYCAVTSRTSHQYKFIQTYGWCDKEGFMRADGERDWGIPDDYYLIALGSYYGTQIGTKYRITLDTGRIFYGVLADCKSNAHTNSTNQYNPRNGNVIEFLVDTKTLNDKVRYHGSANVYMPLNGNISKIERIDFIYE